MREIELKSAANLPYFTLRNGVGDSTRTLGLDVTYNQVVGVNGETVRLYPDSVRIGWIASADSVYSVGFNIKYRSHSQLTTYTSAYIDSAKSLTAAITRGNTLITKILYQQGIIGGFGVALKAGASGNAVATTTAGSPAKIYVKLQLWYTLAR
jgi:hypothetical protein